MDSDNLTSRHLACGRASRPLFGSCCCCWQCGVVAECEEDGSLWFLSSRPSCIWFGPSTGPGAVCFTSLSTTGNRTRTSISRQCKDPRRDGTRSICLRKPIQKKRQVFGFFFCGKLSKRPSKAVPSGRAHLGSCEPEESTLRTK